MKLTCVFLVVTGIIFHLKFSEPKQSLVPHAIHQVIEQHYVKNSVKFEIIYNSNDLDVVDKTLKLIGDLKDYRISKVADDDDFFQYQHSAILIFDSIENFWKRFRKLGAASNGPREINLLIFCRDLIAEYLDKKGPNRALSFLIEEKGEIVLKTRVSFTPKKCRSLQVVDVNKFSRKSMQWTENTFFMTTIRNFHGCPLYFGVPVDNNAPASGHPLLFQTLALYLNFKIVLVWAREDTERDFDLKPLRQIDARSYYDEDMSVPLMTNIVVIAVPPGEPYSPIEIFFLPFDLPTWILFTLVFIFGFTVVIIVKLSRSRSLRVFVVGQNISCPGLNIFGIFMGIGMMRLPRRSIARILLMNFILFSLIMRTAFQGKHFEFMTSEPHKKAIRTVEELIEKNFTLYVYKDTHWNNKNDNHEELNSLAFVEVDRNEMTSKVFKDLQNSSFKGCVIDVDYNFQYHSNGVQKFIVLEKAVVTYNFGIGFKRNSFMSPIFREKIKQLVTGGFYDHWTKYINPKPPPKPYDTVLTLKHLSIGFYIWLLMCLLSTLAFIGELLTYWGPKIARMLFFQYVLSIFYTMQRSMMMMH